MKRFMKSTVDVLSATTIVGVGWALIWLLALSVRPV